MRWAKSETPERLILIVALEDKVNALDDSTRMATVQALNKFNDPRVVEPLIAALKDTRTQKSRPLRPTDWVRLRTTARFSP